MTDTTQAPERIWASSYLSSNIGSCPDRMWEDEGGKDFLPGGGGVEYVRADLCASEKPESDTQQPEPVAFVKSEYVVEAYKEISDEDGQDFRLKKNLSEAMTIRTADEVRNEVLEEAARTLESQNWNDCGCNPCHGHAERDATLEAAADAIRALAQKEGK